MLSKIESLNKTIDAIMKEKNKADAQKEVWEKRLYESLEGYKNEYGVDLSDSSFAGIKEKLVNEIKKVEAQTAEEFEQAQKLVGLIESGDIKGAWKVLGVDMDEPVVEEPEIVEQEGLEGVAEVVESLESDFDDEDLFGSSSTEESTEVGDFFVDEDEEEVEEEKVAPVKALSFDDDDEDDEFVIPDSKPKAPSFSIDDDEDEDPYGGGFGGFGNILKGSKFEVED